MNYSENTTLPNKNKTPEKVQIFAKSNPLFRLLLGILLAFTAIGLLFGIVSLVISYVYEVNPGDFLLNSVLMSTDKEVAMTKILLMLQTISLFGILPLSIIIAFKKKQTGSFIKINSKNHIEYLPFVVLIMFFALPFINFIGEFNSLLVDTILGEDNPLKLMQKQNEALSMKIIKADSVSMLLLNIVVVAVFAGVFEEVCFRGAIQNTIMQKMQKPHIAILITGLLFGLFHFEFYGIIPRTMMGIFFGYLLYWTENLWFPIIAHFTNNASIAIIHYFINKNVIDKSVDTIGGNSETMFLGLISGIVASVLCFLLFRILQRKNPNLSDTSST